MSARIVILLGTKKGLLLLESDAERRHWHLRGPFCDAWPINYAMGDPRTGTIYAAGGNAWFGPAVWRSNDLGASWTHSSEGLTYGEGEPAVTSAWSLAASNGTLYAGVEPAGLFRSEDAGQTWQHVAALRDHPSRPKWMPGAGGLILHAIVPHPQDHNQAWIAISAAGVFHTKDGGASWTPRNSGTRCDFNPPEARYPEVGQCVHGLAMAAGQPARLYQQNHCGMYRSDDGGLSWSSIEHGLPSDFGFPALAHPRDPETFYLVPLNGALAGRYVPDAKAAVWRTRDGGRTWHDLRAGLPQENAFFGVLRQALAADTLDPAGVYFGTSTGSLYGSADEGETWSCIAEHLPPISSVETLVLPA